MNIKYYKLKRQYSENGGVTWLDLGAYKVGDVVETNSSCETDDEQVLTREVQLSVDDAYTCDGYDKRYIISHQQSTDGGIIWTETHQTIGDVAEINSSDCGYDNSTSGSTSGDVIATYYIKDTVNQTKLLGKTDNISAMYVDGVETTLASGYTFSTIGEHTVCYVLINKTQIPYFGFCNTLNSIEIPNSVTSIGNEAFEYCDGLTSIEIPNSVTSIGYAAFYACTSLTSITIPDSVISIGNDAFCYCDTLTSITIPSSVTSIGNSVFYGCDGLKEITCYATTAPTIDSTGTFTGIAKNGTLYHPCGSDYSKWLDILNEPSSHNWTSECFEGSGDNTSGSTSGDVIATYNVTETGIRTNICYKTLVSGISAMYVDGVEKTPASGYTFSTTGEHTVRFVLNTSTLNTSFHDVIYLTSVQIPDNVTLSGWAFYNCQSLTSITIPNSVDVIVDSMMFSGCYNLPVINNIRYADTYAIKPIDKTLTTYTIKTSTKYLNQGLFIDCVNLTNITIPDSVTSIGSNAFNDCASLTSITIPDSVTEISQYLFGNCHNLTSVKIGSGVTSIGWNAFRDCSNLTSIEIPNRVTSIDDGAFADCTSLSSITCNAAIAPTIESMTFQNVASNGVLYYPSGSDYSSWLSHDKYYLGYYGWTGQEI